MSSTGAMMSMTFPIKYGPDKIPPSVKTLLTHAMPRLIEGPHPVLATLREQYRLATVKQVELTGVGFYVDFDVPPDAPLTDPPGFVGGHAEIVVTGVEGAGCVLFVRDGRLLMLECYSCDGTWTEDAKVLEIKSVLPISPEPACADSWPSE
jgi:hypothetical protein